MGRMARYRVLSGWLPPLGVGVVVAVLVAVFVAGVAGCDAQQPPSPPGASAAPRWASQYSGGERTWVPETNRHPAPQAHPIMLINEVTEFPPGAVATAAQEQAAQELVDRCFEAAKRHRWFQFKNGIDQGFELLHGDKRHFYKRE